MIDCAAYKRYITGIIVFTRNTAVVVRIVQIFVAVGINGLKFE